MPRFFRYVTALIFWRCEALISLYFGVFESVSTLFRTHNSRLSMSLCLMKVILREQRGSFLGWMTGDKGTACIDLCPNEIPLADRRLCSTLISGM